MKRSGIISILVLVLLVSVTLTEVVLASSSTVKTGSDSDALYYNTQRKLARSSNGTLYAVYRNTNITTGFTQVYYAYSMDNGTTWTEEQISFPPIDDYQVYPSIAVDSQDNVHVVWSGSGWGANPNSDNIQYRMRNSSGWQATEAVTDVWYSQYYPSIAVDSLDNVHVVWEAWVTDNSPRWENIQYRMRNSSGWQAQENVTDINYDQYTPSIAIDSLDNVHVVWTGFGWGTNVGNGNIQYRIRNSSGWQAQEHVTDMSNGQGGQGGASIAIDSLDNVHIVWNGYGWGTNINYANIEYRMRNSSGWQAQEAVTDKGGSTTQNAPSIAVDFQDNIHVVWSGTGWGTTNYWVENVQYRNKTSSGWQTQIGITDSPGTQANPILIWAEWPDPAVVRTDVPNTGYAFVYISGTGQYSGPYNVTYYASDDLSWGVKTPEAVPEAEPVVGGVIIPTSMPEVLTMALIVPLIALAVAASIIGIALKRKPLLH